jgi:hypothetical protein
MVEMDLQRVLIAVFLFLFSTLLQALPESDSNPGIAFVHGTRDHREDAIGGYWKAEFIHSIAHTLARPANHFVVHCDFSRYMWHEDAALCTAEQLLDFIKNKDITSLTVYTHSNGGNIIRWILSNPTYDKRFLELKGKIKQIIALAPASGGTPLADEVLNGGVFESSVAWILGYAADAVRQQRIGDMLIFNQELLLGTPGRPSLPIPFKVVIGTDVIASPFSSASYCNGYLSNTGLKITNMYLDKCADGFLNCSSQKLAGTVWFYDIDKTENRVPLNHNQSRHSCFGLEQILISALASEGIKQ